MSIKNIISETIQDVIEKLEAHPEIVIDEYTVNPPAEESEIAAESKIPEILKEFFRKSNGLVLSWHAKNDSLVKGGIILPLLENIHNTRWSSFGVLDYTEDVHAVFHKKSDQDSRVMMESLEGDEDIEFVEVGGAIVTIEDYFNAFRQTLGFRFWQENYKPEISYSIDSIIKNRCYLWGDKEESSVAELSSPHNPN